MRGAVPALLGAAVLGITDGALAAGSPPTAGRHYVGRTSQGLSVTATVAGSGAEFAGGRISFELHGGCPARRYFTLSPMPPPAVLISATGHFSFRGTFPPAGTFPFTSTVAVQGQFSQHGKLLTGSGKYTARRGRTTCTSGLIRFTATRR